MDLLLFNSFTTMKASYKLTLRIEAQISLELCLVTEELRVKLNTSLPSLVIQDIIKLFYLLLLLIFNFWTAPVHVYRLQFITVCRNPIKVFH